MREKEEQAALHGLTRALVSNAVEGVTKGWTKELDIVGIGYRAELKGKNTVVFTLGFSHPIEFPLPTGIDVAIDPKQTQLTISGIDRQKVGQVAADMRSLRKPDPYKNKGVRYVGRALEEEGRQDRREVTEDTERGCRAAPLLGRKEQMIPIRQRNVIRQRVHFRIRQKMEGTAERPRLNVYRSLNHIYAQVIDDSKGVTIVSASTLSAKVKTGGNVAAAKEVGKLIAERAKEKGIKKVVFDRGGYLYHGRIKALADAAREAGLEF